MVEIDSDLITSLFWLLFELMESRPYADMRAASGPTKRQNADRSFHNSGTNQIAIRHVDINSGIKHFCRRLDAEGMRTLFSPKWHEMRTAASAFSLAFQLIFQSNVC